MVDPSCLEAIQIQALEQCTQRGQLDQTAHMLSQLIHELDQSEPQGHHLYFSNAVCFSRLVCTSSSSRYSLSVCVSGYIVFTTTQSGGHKLILDQTKTMMERAMAIKPSHVDYVLEVTLIHSFCEGGK